MNAPSKALSVRTKILVALVTGMVVLCIAILAASFFVIQAGFAKIEQDAMRKDVSRLSDQLQNAVHQELVSLNDWSTWDESYHFAEHPNKDFTDTNLKDVGLANLDIEFVSYFDLAGKPIFAKEIDHTTGESVPDDATLAVLMADPLVATRASEEDTLGGFIKVPRGILQFGSRPLLQSTGEGPTTGSLVFARYLDAARVKAIGDVLHLSVDAYPYDATDLPADVAAAKARIDAGQEEYVAPLSASSIAGYLELHDIHGAPILIFRITETRPIYAQGNLSIATFYAIGGAALLLFGALVLFLLDRLVIARFVRLTKTVQTINDTKDLSMRVEGGEMDEIGTLAGHVNQMLTWLSESKEAEASARREMVNLLSDLKQTKEQQEEIDRITGNNA
jgi:sensor domain CHASE-containing protein